MPVESCHAKGKPGFRWGSRGKCYTYKSGNEKSRQKAIEKAQSQGQAIKRMKL